MAAPRLALRITAVRISLSQRCRATQIASDRNGPSASLKLASPIDQQQSAALVLVHRSPYPRRIPVPSMISTATSHLERRGFPATEAYRYQQPKLPFPSSRQCRESSSLRRIRPTPIL